MTGHSESVEFDATCHSADAIQRAAYRFIDKFSLLIRSGETSISCTLVFDAKFVEQAPRLVQDFRKEVLDQVLRERIRAETEAVRSFILALAFSRTGLIDTDSKL
jgi:His-Xaa-Ser system protein HxsD